VCSSDLQQFVRRPGDPAPLSAAEIDECYACFETQDFAIGYQAFLDKARPEFTGR
jgi:enoyl-CoA hydratase